MYLFKNEYIRCNTASTIIPSKSLMIDDKVGSIEKGKIADILVWNIPDVKTYSIFSKSIKYKFSFKKRKPVFTA